MWFVRKFWEITDYGISTKRIIKTLFAWALIFGYVLLGALITRFAVLFTAGGPAGAFADEKE